MSPGSAMVDGSSARGVEVEYGAGRGPEGGRDVELREERDGEPKSLATFAERTR
jgi:hypothetical protein